jgi:hypothetical protein
MNRLMTPAPIIHQPPERIPTGNLEISLPAISRRDGGVYSVGALSMKANGLISVTGSEADHQPLLVPFLMQGGHPVQLDDLGWERLAGWVPRFHARAAELEVHGTIFSPPGEKGFVYLLEVEAGGVAAGLQIGMQGWWHGVDFGIFTGHRVDALQRLWHDPWSQSLVGEASVGLPLIAWGLQAPDECRLTLDGIHFEWIREVSLAAGEQVALAFYCALNLETDGARTGALHLRRRGVSALLEETLFWLDHHRTRLSDEGLERVLNENLFFNHFFTQGNCIDTGELALVTSRSDSYYVSAAYWARDALLWSFPGLLLVDRHQAQAALECAWTRYLPLGSQHALYINGQNLYPGFELDQACAPLLALGHYLEATSDWEFALGLATPAALRHVQADLEAHFSIALGLYSTFLTPHDDPTEYPYLTYNNVLVWACKNILADLNVHRDETQLAARLRREAKRLRQTILAKCVVNGPFGDQFCGGVDEQGCQEMLDLPGASWSLFPYYHFCTSDDPIYQNALRWISSPHNPYYFPGRFGGAGAAHFPYPSSFDLANRLLRRDPRALDDLHQLPMDQGLCCESYDPDTGVVRTGAAFASMAGFLAFCIARSQQDEALPADHLKPARSLSSRRRA